MKKILAILAAMVCCGAMGQTAIETEAVVGFAGIGSGVTGGNGQNPVTVTTLKEFKRALQDTLPRTIYVSGTLVFPKKMGVDDIRDKTIIGLPGAVFENTRVTEEPDSSGILSLNTSHNVIIRNITFKGAGAYDIDGSDNLCLSRSTNIWVDHCDFQDGVDCNFDCSKESDNITVSWCRFRYLIAPKSGGSGGSADHRFSNLWGGSDKYKKDEGKLKTTFAFCWWDEGCQQRMPRVRYSQMHIVGCLFSSSVAKYCIGAGYRSNIFVDRSVFVGQKSPWKCYATSKGYTDYNIRFSGCVGATDAEERSGDVEYFDPNSFYPTLSFNVADVEAAVRTRAGATLK